MGISFTTACNERTDDDYFSMNWSDLYLIWDCMKHLGMLDYCILGPSPEVDPWVKSVDGVGYRLSEEWFRHNSWHPSPSIGIAAHKLLCNDHWVVTQEECEAALVSLANNEDPGAVVEFCMNNSVWRFWVRYLQRAAKAGGFIVS